MSEVLQSTGAGREDLDKLIEAALERRRQQERQDLLARFGLQGLAWLALAPVWSESLAGDTRIGFPTGSLALPAFLDQALEARLIERSVPPKGGGLYSYYQGQAVAALAPHLPEEGLPDALQVALAIEGESARADALVALAPRLPDALWRQAWPAAINLKDDRMRGRALLALLASAPSALLASAVDLLLGLATSDGRGQVLRMLAGALLPTGEGTRQEQSQVRAFLQGLVSQAAPITAALAAAGLLALTRTTVALAGRLNDERRARVWQSLLSLARSQPEPELRARLLSLLLPQLAAPEREQVAAEALAAAQAVTDESARGALLAELAAPANAESVLQAALALEVEGPRAQALCGLVPVLPEAALPSVLAAARDLADEDLRPTVLLALAPRLPGELAPAALEAALSLADERYRAALLAALAPRLTPRLIEPALAIVESLTQPAARAEALAGLAPALAGPTLDRALELARALPEPAARSLALAGLLPYLPASRASEARLPAVQAAREIEDQAQRAQVLAALASALASSGGAGGGTAGDGLQDLREVALDLADYRQRSLAFCRIATAQGAEARAATNQLALEAAGAVLDPADRAEALAGVLPALPRGEIDRPVQSALDALAEVGEPDRRARILAQIAPFLSARTAAGALTALRTMGPERLFWMPDELRPSILADLRAAGGASLLFSEAINIGNRVMGALRQPDLAVPRVLARWAELAVQQSGQPGEAARWFNERVQHVIDSGETGEALAWLETGESQAAAFGSGEMVAAVRLANRRLELAYRERHDRRRLVHFVERPGQIQAFRDLLAAGPDQPWALHFLGMGGVGKTMLLRFITARLARDSGALTARVDFDHLSPDYPVRRPAQLLIELAQELRLYITNSTQQLRYDDLQKRVIELHEELGKAVAAQDPLQVIAGPLFAPILGAFCRFVDAFNTTVVLILDTAEELAKAQLLGGRLLNVECTFLILKLVHDGTPEVPKAERVRAVFAGRRLLAQAGANYAISASGPGVPEAKRLLPERVDYLRLYEIRGFDRSEALSYLVEQRGLRSDSPLLEALLQASCDVGSAAQVDWIPPAPADQTERFNPFDLAYYAEWVLENPKLRPEDLRAEDAADPYIDIRILRRLNNDEMRRLMPVVTLLRRFDKASLRRILPTPPADFDSLFRELGDQEWLDYQYDQTLDTTFLEVDRNLQPRLWAYFQHPTHRQELDLAREAIGPGLAELVERNLDDAMIEYVNAALLCVPPKEGARLWDLLLAHSAQQPRWDRILALTTRLLGEDGALGIGSHPLRAAVHATHLAATLHQPPRQVVPAEAWSEVERNAGAYADATQVDWLRDRALAGQITGLCRAGLLPQDELVAQFTRRLNRFWASLARFASAPPEVARYRGEQLAAAMLGALDALLDLWEELDPWEGQPQAAAVVEPLAVAAGEWAETLESAGYPPQLAAFAHCQAGRAAAMLGQAADTDRAAEQFARAEQIWAPVEAAEVPAAGRRGAKAAADQAPARPVADDRWADWLPPLALRERLRLERLRGMPRDHFPAAGERATSLQEALARLDTIDGERLASLLVATRLDAQPIASAELERLAALARRGRPGEALGRAHRVVPPLFVTVALGWLALGRAGRAFSELDEHPQALESDAGHDPVTAETLKRARAAVVRRMRVFDKAASKLAQLAPFRDPRDAALAWAILGLVGGQQSTARPAAPTVENGGAGSSALVHAWWSGQPGAQGLAGLRSAQSAEQVPAQAFPAASGAQSASAPGSAGPVDYRVSLLIGMFGLRSASPPATYAQMMLALDSIEYDQVAAHEGLRQPTGPVPFSMQEVAFWRSQRPLSWEQGWRLYLRAAALLNPAELGTALPDAGFPRRWAEIALEEGELLALRLPARAVPLLDLAAAGYEAAGDPAGKLCAAILAALATLAVPAAARKGKALAVRAGDILDLYAEVQKRGLAESLPPLAVLDDASAAPDVASLRSLQHPDWGGWLARLMRVVAADRTQPGSPAAAGVEKWLAEQFPGETPPAELNLAGAPVPAEKAARSRPRLRISLGWAVLLGWVIVLGFFVASVIETMRQPSSVQSPTASSTWFNLGWALGALVMTVVTVLALTQVGRLWVKNLWTARSRAQLAINTGLASWLERRSTRAIGAQFELAISAQTLLPRPAAAPEVDTRRLAVQGATPGFTSYAQAAQNLPPMLAQWLANLQGDLGARRLPLALVTDGAAAGDPWEAVLTLALPVHPQPGKWQETFRFWRAGPVRNDPVPSTAALKKSPVLALCAPGWQRLVEQGWSDLGALATNSDLDPAAARGPYRLVHLIGSTERTQDGLRFQYLAGDAQQISDPAVKSGVDPARAGRLLRSDQLPLKGVPLVVLQAEPVTDYGGHDEADRQRTAELRALASELCAAGANAVLLLPHLPSETAVAVLRDIAWTLKRHPWPRLPALLNMANSVRRWIADSPGPGAGAGGPTGSSTASAAPVAPGDAVDLALEVTLFARGPLLQ